MTFEKLIEIVSSPSAPDICLDSRRVKPGDCFIAVKGTRYDGHDFIDAAVLAGAKYIVCKSGLAPAPVAGGITAQEKIQFIEVPNTSIAAAVLAQARYANPAKKLTNLAVTGTNGKTTVAYLVRSVIQTTGQNCGLIGTVVYDTSKRTDAATLTTPDSLQIAQMQHEMVQAETKYMIIEASSHALSQNRLHTIDFTAAAFTNLTGDHLDYHKTEDNYLAAKSVLFETLSPDAVAVLNKESPHSKQIAGKTKAKILWYGIDTETDLAAKNVSTDINGTSFILHYGSNRTDVTTPLLGTHNVSNHLAAAGLCLVAGFDLPTVAAGLSALKSVPGRLEKVDFDGDFTILIDYAHTDDALKNVLTTLRPLCKGKLRVLFGCGGDRDRTKRPRMAAVAEKLADYVIVTSDNPRTEPPEYIIGEIMTGFEKPTADKIYVELEREDAIKYAIKTACKDDIILIAGKGHETYQIIGDKTIEFSDTKIAKKYLA